MLKIPDLKKDDKLESDFLIAEKHLFKTKDGKPFLKLILMNRTGRIEGTLWDNAGDAFNRCAQGQIIRVRGVVIMYQDELRLRLYSLSPVPESHVTTEDFLPSSHREVEEMEAELHRVIRAIGNPFLRRLMESIFRDPKVWELFSRAPAAKSMHHAYRGGLLEHTLSLASLVRLVSKNYPFLNQDLMLAGALTHDLGKSWELSPELGFDYTDPGRLLGHIILGLDVLGKKISAIPDFPESLALQMKHLVASHHGELEYGSPKQPMTLEALCLHGLDDLDAKMWGILGYMQQQSRSDERWTEFHRIHQRYFHVPENFPEPVTPADTTEEGNQHPESPPKLFKL